MKDHYGYKSHSCIECGEKNPTPLPDNLCSKCRYKALTSIENALCSTCRKRCKQTSLIKIAACPQYTPTAAHRSLSERKKAPKVDTLSENRGKTPKKPKKALKKPKKEK